MPSSSTRLFVILWLMGLAGLASLLTVPLEQIQPPQLHFTAVQFRLLSLINPFILLTIFVAIGGWLGPKVQLDAPVLRALSVRQAVWPIFKPQLLTAITVGIIAAVILLAYAQVTSPWFAAVPHADLAMPLTAKVLYGGIVEELLTRWGLMSLFVRLGWKLAGSPITVPTWAYLIGALAAALLFAAGHLPLLYLLAGQPTAEMIGAVMIGNTLPGLVFAWAFRRRGLEAAMLGHGLAHVIATAFW